MSCAPGSVIIVDDDDAVRDALKFALELEGFPVCVYRSGAELLTDPDLAACRCLVIDQYMPAMNGLELIRRLRERGVTAPAILITARPNNRLRDRAALGGVHCVLDKPLEGSALLDAIRSAGDEVRC